MLSGSALNAQQLVPVRCEARRSEFPPKAPGLAFACRAGADPATAEAGIELIDRTHAPDRPRVVGLIEQAALHTARWRQIEKRAQGQNSTSCIPEESPEPVGDLPNALLPLTKVGMAL